MLLTDVIVDRANDRDVAGLHGNALSDVGDVIHVINLGWCTGLCSVEQKYYPPSLLYGREGG